MLDTSRNWQLFGYDAGQLGRRWLAGWRDFLWDEESPVRLRLAEVVRVRDGERLRYFHSGREVSGGHVECDAIALPESRVLARMLRIPAAAEAELDAVMAMEVNANSPFPESDTGYGWKIITRDEQHLGIQLVVVSLSATMSFLGSEYDHHDAGAQEVWAELDTAMIMLHGFGEQDRQQRYRKRLLRVSALLAISALVLLAIVGLAAAAKYQELHQLQDMHEDYRQQAEQASAMRGSLVAANEIINEVGSVVQGLPGPRGELARLTRLLGDQSYITRLTMAGREITLRGRAVDAAAVMQKLIEEPAYPSVTAPEAFRKLRGSGLEEFRFQIVLAAGEQG